MRSTTDVEVRASSRPGKVAPKMFACLATASMIAPACLNYVKTCMWALLL